jgi:hypothetical protein
MHRALCYIITTLCALTAFSGTASEDPARRPPALPVGHWIQARKTTSTSALVRNLGGEYHREGRHERISFIGKRLTTPDLLELGRSPQIRHFYWNGSGGLEPEGMAAFAGMPELETLLLWSVGTLTDDSLIHLAGCRKLQVLNLGANGRVFTGAGLRHLAGCTSLRHLTLNHSPALQDDGVKQLAAIRSLEVLLLNNCPQLTDASLDSLIMLPKLSKLYVIGTAITEAGLLKLARVKSLKWLEVRPAQLSPEGARQLKKALPKLEVVFINN